MKSTVDATRMRVVYARVLALFQQAASQPARITPYIYDVMLSFDGTADTFNTPHFTGILTELKNIDYYNNY